MKERKRFAIGKALIATVLMSTVLTACWDKVEINDLALVSMFGVDIDPETGIKTLYYQIINPLAVASSKSTSGGEQAPVYTYKLTGKSFGEIRSLAYKVLPRKLFVAHYKAVVVSERTAQHGLREIINYIEVQSTARSSIPMLVADGSIDKIMKIFLPFDRLPSDSVASRLRLLTQESLLMSKHIRVKDFSEQLYDSKFIVMPMIRGKSGSAKQRSSEIASNIDAEENNLFISGAALFHGDRMIDRLNDTDLIWYHLLSGVKGKQTLKFQLDGKKITLQIKQVNYNKTVKLNKNKPVLTINMDLQLSAGLATEPLPQNWEEVKDLERKMKQYLTSELNQFFEKTSKKGWDLLDIRGEVKRTFPRKAKMVLNNSQYLKEADVVINVGVKFLNIGSIIKPF